MIGTMRAAVLHAPGDISVDQVDDPILVANTDAVVRVTASCICGSDLWHYRGRTSRRGRIGHEFIGVVEEIGADVQAIRTGQVVVAPFVYSCGSCSNCLAGWTTSCLYGGDWGMPDRNGYPVDGGQGEFVRVPLADGTLVPTRVPVDDFSIPAVLALSDVMGTGHHAAISAGAGPGRTIVVVGDGAVGLCAVLASARLGAERIIVLSTHADRSAIAETFGATDIVAARGDEAVQAVLELTNGLGADGACECVGTIGSWETALDVVRPGGAVGYVGVPHGVPNGLPLTKLFDRNITVRGGVAPVRTYLPALLDDVLEGVLDPSPVFTETITLTDIARGYAEMDSRQQIKVLVKP
jgi:threonine dehydrogenase-like Zn-dependent dehydrogenase